ncbi:CHAT domain-containing protein [Microseira sp. BLCC-F43]|uniref:CHAT domain-containing protein n=1 Tax=Microseira sp. BLCC-F43 TaxID=3153602 RepID=UPI0035BBD1EF
MHRGIYHLSIVTATLLFSLICPVQPTTNNLGIKNALAQAQNGQSSPASSLQDRKAETTRLLQQGQQQFRQSQFREALQTFQQALVIAREIGDKTLTAIALNNIGAVYYYLSQYPKALEFYQQALAIRREAGDKAGEGKTLNNIGSVYDNLSQYPKALEFYQQALAIRREAGDKAGEGTTLNNMGFLLAKQNQPELAIVFYKQSVNVRETIRQDLRVLPREQQESYTKTVADTYRALADLLIAQGRILEAQQVLELLKIQELRDYTRNARAGGQTSGIALNPTEEQIIKTYGSLIAFRRQVDECKQTRCSQLSQLNEQLQAVTQQYNQTVQALKKPISDRLAQDRAFLNPETLAGRKAKEIVESQPGTVLIYPFVLDDKIWLLWASQGGIIKSVEVPVTRRQLGEAVLEFRQVVQDANSGIDEVEAAGKKLYDWLIKPLESELKANKVQNLVFSLDRVTRYIPMGALFDGERYLIENYSVSTVLSADLTDLRDRLPPGTQNTRVLALGLSNAVAGFNSLPNVPAELDAIVRKQPGDTKGIYPGTEFLNNAFDFPTLRDNLLGKKILHIATHGDFVRGRPEDSFLLLGTGEKLTIPQIETLQDLSDIHLVVLSACETALGGPDADGLEIAGISYYFINRGAKAVMASLWQVSDASTSLLMQNLSSNLANGNITKTAALRQAQLSLLQGNRSQFTHPYYWSAFILIGNGL